MALLRLTCAAHSAACCRSAVCPMAVQIIECNISVWSRDGRELPESGSRWQFIHFHYNFPLLPQKTYGKNTLKPSSHPGSPEALTDGAVHIFQWRLILRMTGGVPMDFPPLLLGISWNILINHDKSTIYNAL